MPDFVFPRHRQGFRFYLAHPNLASIRISAPAGQVEMLALSLDIIFKKERHLDFLSNRKSASVIFREFYLFHSAQL